jgi:hypothetical protein
MDKNLIRKNLTTGDIENMFCITCARNTNLISTRIGRRQNDKYIIGICNGCNRRKIRSFDRVMKLIENSSNFKEKKLQRDQSLSEGGKILKPRLAEINQPLSFQQSEIES